MEHRPQLPPITTHFAEFFPRPTSLSALVTSSDDAQDSNRPPKRKRSDPEVVEGTGPSTVEREPEARQPVTSGYRSNSTGEPEPKRFAPHYSRNHVQRHSIGETNDADYARKTALTSPRHYSAYNSRLSSIYDNRQIPSESRQQETKPDRISHSRLHSVDWLSNVPEPRPPENNSLPPLSRSKSPPAKIPEDRWGAPWRGGAGHYPAAPMEPKASYYQVQPAEKADTTLAAESAPTEPARIPPFVNISSAGSTAHSQPSDARRSSTSSRHYALNSIKSPTDTSERLRGLAALQYTPSTRSSRENHLTHAGLSKSPSDSSPVSSRAPPASPPRYSAPAMPGSPQRYTWDAPGLYEHTHRKRRGNLPKESTALLTEWFNEHAAYPYPKEAEKQALQVQTGLAMSQISNWFVNARRRRRPLGSSAARVEHPHLRYPSTSRDRDPLHTTRYR